VDLMPPLIAQDPAAAWPVIGHSCMQSADEVGDPGVRLTAFANAFGQNALYLPVCAPSFAPALQTIAQRIGQAVPPPMLCIGAVLADSDPSTPGLQPDCTVADLTPNAQGTTVASPIPACASQPTARPCWQLASDPGCPGTFTLQVMRTTVSTETFSTSI